MAWSTEPVVNLTTGFRTPTRAEKWAEVRSTPPEVLISGQVGGGLLANDVTGVSMPGHRLSERAAWRVLHRACRRASLAEAVQTATESLTRGGPVYRQHASVAPDDLFADEHDLVSFAVEHDVHGRHYAVTLTTSDEALGWHAGRRATGPDQWSGRVDRSLRRHRMWLLTRALRNYRWSTAPTAQVIAEAEGRAHLLSTHAAVLHWWDDRLDEGHNVESARTMLALLAPASLLARIEWSPKGHPLPRRD